MNVKSIAVSVFIGAAAYFVGQWAYAEYLKSSVKAA